jgi:choline dehydrogenase
LKPKSRGRILLRSADPLDKPIIQANYLEAEEDVQILVHGLKEFKKIFETDVFEGIAKYFDTGSVSFERDTEEYWTAFVKQNALTVYHPVSHYYYVHTDVTR